MAIYEWRGIDSSGKRVKGVRDAESPKGLRATLRRDGILVTDVVEETEAQQRKSREIDFRRLFRRISTMDIAVSTRQLATLLRSGIPLVEALTALTDQLEHPELKTAFTQTRDKVNEGTSFADALRAHPNIFSTLYVNMVAAGEASGTLEQVLSRLAEFLEGQARLRNKVGSALAYPILMAFIGVAVLGFLMVFVVPKVTAIFENFDRALPWYTQMLIFISDMFSNWWWLMAIVLGGAAYGFQRWRSTENGRHKWDRFVLGVPQFGRLVTLISVARFARTLATLLSAGVPILRAMEITRNILGNTELMRVVEEARGNVREGESIAKPLQQSGRFPPIVTHMIAIGERSGQLEEMLEHVADAYDQQVEARVAAMTSLLEPLMILVMGGMAGTIAFSILMPLLQINQFIQ